MRAGLNKHKVYALILDVTAHWLYSSFFSTLNRIERGDLGRTTHVKNSKSKKCVVGGKRSL
jgi:hypothetical protein